VQNGIKTSRPGEKKQIWKKRKTRDDTIPEYAARIKFLWIWGKIKTTSAYLPNQNKQVSLTGNMIKNYG